MKLGLKDTQQRELVHVTLHCCLQVSTINQVKAVTELFMYRL